jgi:hypothetical protein
LLLAPLKELAVGARAMIHVFPLVGALGGPMLPHRLVLRLRWPATVGRTRVEYHYAST